MQRGRPLESYESDASGLEWQCAGNEKPETGVELTNTELANSLKSRNMKRQFNEEDWQGFGIDDLRMGHFIERSDGSYAWPELPSGLVWKLSEPKHPTDGVELTNPELSDALKLKTAFTAEEWSAFGISELQQEHFIQSGNSYFKPFELPEGFLPSDSRRSHDGAPQRLERAASILKQDFPDEA